MKQRMEIGKTAPEGYRAVLDLERYVHNNVDATLLELVKIRASILNNCAFCIDMHTTDALKAGEHQRRLFAVAAWQESPFFDDRERLAFALTDALTEMGRDGVRDEIWAAAQAMWSEKELADLILAISVINVWNRIAVSTHTQPPALV